MGDQLEKNLETLMATELAKLHPAWFAHYGALLESHTREVPLPVGTVVAYRGLLEDPAAAAWRELLSELATTPPPRTRAEKLAVWINAYNILAIDTVLRSYPVESIREIGGLFRSVWKLDAGTVAGRAVTLHEIEHEILRPMGDPRIHAAIVCASTSCPSLTRTPFRAESIDHQLDLAMERWLASPDKGLRIDRAAGRIFASSIFDWFEGDFEITGGIRGTLARFAPPEDRAWLTGGGADAPIAFLPYDWSLNDAAPAR